MRKKENFWKRQQKIAKKLRLSKSDEKLVGPVRFRLLKRLSRTGYPVTPRTIDEYTQMTLSECRDHVARNEAVTRPKTIQQALSLGFAVGTSTGKTSFDGRFSSGVTLLSRKLADGRTQRMRVHYSSTNFYGSPFGASVSKAV